MIELKTEYLKRRGEFWALGIVFLLAIVHGLLYVFIIPPWQHYDEPNHFEYVWLYVDHGGKPNPGDFDTDMLRDVLSSMIEHGFFEGMESQPNINSVKPWIGRYSQLDEPPLYYLIASLPLRLNLTGDVTGQLYLARLVSLFLYLITVAAGWGVTAELFPQGHPLRVLLPLTIALIPAFTDLMTAVNNDVGAVAFFSLFLWGGIRLVRRDFSALNLLWATICAGLCVLTKSIAFFAVPMLGMFVLFAVLRRGVWRRLAWVLLSIGVVVGLLLAITWGDAAYWYRATSQEIPTRTAYSGAPHGEHVFQLGTLPEITPVWLVPISQAMPPTDAVKIIGKPVTLGFWMWSTQPMQVETPILNAGELTYSQMVEVTESPQFFAFTASLPEEADPYRLWVTLSPVDKYGEVDAVVYYDGIVLADGERPLQEAPQFEDTEGARGVWGDDAFENLLRNGSMEKGGFVVRSPFDSLGTKLLPDQTRPSFILASLFDLRGAGWFYRQSGEKLVRTFWAVFGWGHVLLTGRKPYRILSVFTLLGFIGAGLVAWRNRRKLPWDIIFLMGVALIGIWLPAFVRGAIYLVFPKQYFPIARYTYPAIIPTVIPLTLGWYEILRLATTRLRLPSWFPLVLYGVIFLGLDIWALSSVVRFYSN